MLDPGKRDLICNVSIMSEHPTSEFGMIPPGWEPGD